MVAMRMMQVAIHQIVNVVAMGNLWMTAIRPVNVALLMPTTFVAGCATVRIGGGYRDHTFVHMISVDMMQVPVV